VLCGDPAAPGAPADLRDLADTVAALRGEDAPSKALLAEIARRSNAAALVVVRADAGAPPSARVFLAENHEFDAATYAPDAGPGIAWSSTARSLARAFATSTGAPATTSSPGSPAATTSVTPPHRGTAASAAPAPALATRTAPKPAESQTSRPFYVSPWFWGALGVAAVVGGGAYLLSRDNGSSTIHLQLQGP
jgi:hypothetical protein